MAKRQKGHSKSGSSSRTYKPKNFLAACVSCGIKVVLPFEPDLGKPLFCVECFQKNRK